MMKKLLTLLIAGIFLISLANALIVSEEYNEDFFIDASSYPLTSCNIQSNWEAGHCEYLYSCYAIVPKGSTTLDQVIQKECVDITDTKKTTLSVRFVPPKGNVYAVTTFVAVLKYNYNYDTYEWEETIDLPLDYRTAMQIISLCPDGQMLKYNLCYNAQSVCLDTFSTNMCTNPYSLYVLDYGYGFDYQNTNTFCSDRDGDLVCDEIISHLCPDTNNNGVCDSDDTAIQDVSCLDLNHNFVCDSVEAEGTFCRTNYEPVHCGIGEGCLTYPNFCFAEASGCIDWLAGECSPVYGDQCYSNSDCPSMCDGVSGICKDPDGFGNRCFYSGECNPRIIQCSVKADCPQPYCVGIDVECTATNTCVYNGKCITQPTPPPTFWQLLKLYWIQFLNWLSGLF